MAQIPNITGVRRSFLVFALTGTLCIAQTNTTKPHPIAAPVANPIEAFNADAVTFFTKYKVALAQLEVKKVQDAGITLDLLARSLNTSPWLEIAMMKHAQLVEDTNDRVAEEDYNLLRERLENAPYFEGKGDRAKIFGTALQGAVDLGINRIRLRRVRVALDSYRNRYNEYPESLAKLAILGYTDIENIRSVNNQLFRYVPQQPKMNPFVSFKSCDLEKVAAEPFIAPNVPILEATSQVSEKPLKYAALIRVSSKEDPLRIVENQTINGYFVAAIVHDGVILSTPTRVVVLTPTP